MAKQEPAEPVCSNGLTLEEIEEEWSMLTTSDQWQAWMEGFERSQVKVRASLRFPASHSSILDNYVIDQWFARATRVLHGEMEQEVRRIKRS